MTHDDRKIPKMAWVAVILVPLLVAAAYGLHMRRKLERTLDEPGLVSAKVVWRIARPSRNIYRSMPMRWTTWTLVLWVEPVEPPLDTSDNEQMPDRVLNGQMPDLGFALAWDPILGEWVTCRSWKS